MNNSMKILLMFILFVNLFIESWSCGRFFSSFSETDEPKFLTTQRIPTSSKEPEYHTYINEDYNFEEHDYKYISNEIYYDIFGRHIRKRDVTGKESPIYKFPYHVSLENNGKFLCGGAIISKTFSLTSAHCTLGSIPTDLLVRAGSENALIGGQVVQVKKIHNHPDYNIDTGDNDLAILELKYLLILSGSVKAIKLADHVPSQVLGVVSGWGSSDISNSQILSSSSVMLKSWEQCIDHFGQSFSQNMICGDYVEGAECIVNFGAPLVSAGALLGVLSGPSGCHKSVSPVVFTNIVELREFISSVTDI